MSSQDRIELLEARAERGTHRGAEVVWRNATAAAEQDVRRGGDGLGFGGFRLAVGAFAVAMVALMGFGIERGRHDSAEPIVTEPILTDPGQQDAGEPDHDQSPRRILIEGMGMSSIQAPADPDFVGDDDFLDRVPVRVTDSNNVFPASPDEEPAERVIFADRADPFANPILGIDLLDGGGFRPWGMNLGDTALEELTESLSRTGGEWTVGEDSDLVEVARLSGEPYDLLRFGWQFDFRSGPEGAIWQAEPHEGAGVWVWVARIVGTSSVRPTTTVTEVRVLDRPGILVEESTASDPSTDPGRQSNIFWVDGDFVYRLTADRIEGNTVYGADPVPLLPRLRIVDDETWDDQVANANFGGPSGGFANAVDLAVLVLWLASIVYFLVRGPRFLAVLGVLAIGYWLFFVGSGSVVTVVFLGGLVATWLWYRWWQNPQAAQQLL